MSIGASRRRALAAAAGVCVALGAGAAGCATPIGSPAGRGNAASPAAQGDGATAASPAAPGNPTRGNPRPSGGSTTTAGPAPAPSSPPAGDPGPATDPKGPDLQLYTLPECSVVPGGALSGADGLTIFVAIRNGGPGAWSRAVPWEMSSGSGHSTRGNSGISTGSSFTALQVDLRSGDYNRSHRFTVRVDPGNQVVERDESNNTLTVTVRLPARPASATDVPCSSP